MPTFLKTILITALTLSILGTFGIASGAFNEQINYQGKLTDSSSIPVSDGNHCMEFALYTVATNGASIWSEEWDSATSYAATNSGLFSVLLGTHQSLSSIDFNQTSLYLEVRYDPGCDNVYEEIFSPRKRFGAVPSAFESKQLGGKAETAFGTLSESEAVIGAWTFSDLLTVTEVPTGVLVNQGSLYINPATAAADYTLLGLAVGGVEKFRVDEDGDVAIEGDISFTGSQTISTTAGDLALNPAGNLALSSNSITGLGTGITASGALTISTTGANNLTLTPGTGLTTTGSTFQITGGLLDVDTYADIAYSDAAIAALTVTQSGTGGIVDFKDGANSVFTVADGGNTAIANISATTGSAFSVTRNLASGSTNSAIVSFIQSNASDDQPNLSLTNAGTGNSLTIDQNGNVGTAVATDGALFVENTGNTGIGLNVYSNIGATSAAGLVYFTADNDAFDQEVLTVRQDGAESIVSFTNTTDATSGAFTLTNLGSGNSFLVEDSASADSTPFVIDADGNVGIGAINKLSKLTIVQASDETDIGGTTSANAATTITGSITTFLSDLGIGDRISLSSAASTYATVTAIASDTSLTVDSALGDGTSQTINTKHSVLRLENSSNAVKMIVNDLGDVGIGTMNIAARLTVTQTATGDIINLKDGANNTILDISDEGQADFKPSAFDYAVRYNGSTFETAVTAEAKTAGGTPFTILGAEASSDDEFYVGLDNTFDSVYFDIDTAGSVVTLSAQYYNGSAWIALSITDNTSNLSSDNTVTFAAPANWATTSIDSQTKYWVRFRSPGTNIATAPTTYSVSPTTGTRFAVYGQQGDSSAAFSIDDKGDISISGDITYPTSGSPKRTIILTAAGAIPPTANGAAQTKIDGTNHTYYVLDFDATTDESVFWHWTMPDSYDNGTIDITYYWEAAATTNEVTWCFQAKGLAANNAEDIDSALSAAVCEVDTAQGNANDLASVTESVAASNFAAGEYVAFKVFRDADVSEAGADDDMAGDARLVKVKIEYSVSSESD